MSSHLEKAFQELIDLRFQLYNGLFLDLPLDAVQQAGTLLPVLQEACSEEMPESGDPLSIIEGFFRKHKPGFSELEQIAFLFKVIQYVERQIVLIDALEDSAYARIHGVGGADSWEQLSDQARRRGLDGKLAEILAQFGVRVVLTAHPTQFYPETVLAIISDLTKAININRTADARDLLQQLGQTPFFPKRKPSPYDEALRLTTYLEQVFYPAVGKLLDMIGESHQEAIESNRGLIRLGFWPGGDRDGNPFVTVDVTRKVAAKLRYSIVKCYHEDVKRLKRRLSFAGVYERLSKLEERLLAELSNVGEGRRLELQTFLAELENLEAIVREKHLGLYLDHVVSLKRKALSFGFHFASLDLRQDSRMIRKTLDTVRKAHPQLFPKNFDELNDGERLRCLFRLKGTVEANEFQDPLVRDTLESMAAMREIQTENGEDGAHRYIISNCRSPLDIAVAYALFRLSGWDDDPLTVDVVPLFETIADLQGAAETMSTTYEDRVYRAHLKERSGKQTVMLGFSDGTKDGGYVMANWAIFSAKEQITTVSRQCGVEVVFFDGRGGPPGRGGGKSHLFYAALGRTIERTQIQMTLQGQTISSHYGIEDAAVHNMELLLTAGLKNRLFAEDKDELNASQRRLLSRMAETSHRKYRAFKKHPLFMPYLVERSTLLYYGKTNIGSRPMKRGDDRQVRFEDLRAIPFVGAWSQLKQNVPGYFGLGTALKEQETKGNLEACMKLYNESGFFRAIVANSMQSMTKTNFSLTRYMERDPRFGEFWRIIHEEFELTRGMVLKVSGQKNMMEDSLQTVKSIRLRERVVLPLLTIQQYALIKIHQADRASPNENRKLYEKMVIRSLFGNTNASRNSV